MHIIRASRPLWLFAIFAVFALYQLVSRRLSTGTSLAEGPLFPNPETPQYELGKGRLEVPPGKAIPSTLHWAKPSTHFPVQSTITLPSGKPQYIAKIQHKFPPESEGMKIKREMRLDMVKATFQRSWHAYQKQAWKHDELSPVSGSFKDPFNGWGATLVDTLDTLYIMDLKDEFLEAITAVKGIDFTTSIRRDIPLFETTIRYLGGLLAAYDVSGAQHAILLEKAIVLGGVLMGAFDTPNHMPVTYYHWDPASTSQQQRARSMVVLAELGSLTLEFTRLAQLTNNSKYYDAVARITDELEKWQMNTNLPGMWPVYVDASGCSEVGAKGTICKPGGLRSSAGAEKDVFTLGGRSDSVFEYLPKEYLLLGGLETKYRTLYEQAMRTIQAKLIFRPMTRENADILIAGSLAVTKNTLQDTHGTITFNPHNTHLTCFAGGMIAMGARIFERPDELSVAMKLTDGCVWAYNATATGIMPEEYLHVPCPSAGSCSWEEALWREALGSHVKEDLPSGMADISRKRYILRPEAIESVFYLYRITGDEQWREKGWRMFNAIETTTQTEFGNSAIDDVTVKNPVKADLMQSFWTAETLKYFWLLFSNEDVISLDDYVFNTEAHPFMRPK